MAVLHVQTKLTLKNLVAILALIILIWTIRRLLLYKIFLYDNKDIFVTKQSPDLGFTDLVQHKIILRPDAKPKYQRPYRLSPDKKEVLRHHLDNLLNQGIISAVSPDEDLPITSPIMAKN